MGNDTVPTIGIIVKNYNLFYILKGLYSK